MSQLFGGATRLIKAWTSFAVQGLRHAGRALLASWAKRQSPARFLITCSDSRINPNVLTQTGPGELIILRTAGNLIPPAGSPCSGEEATIEYAIVQLKIRDIIVCGHSHCGAIHGLLGAQCVDEACSRRSMVGRMPVRHLASELPASGSLPPEELLDIAIERNVLLQVEHLKTLPSVVFALAAGKLRIHAWVYHFETGEVVAHDPKKGRFVPLAEAAHQKFVKEIAPRTELEDEWHGSI